MDISEANIPELYKMLLWVIICSHRNNRLYHFLYLVQMQGFEVKSDEIVAMVSQHGDGRKRNVNKKTVL